MRILLSFTTLVSLVHAITIPNLLGRTQSNTCASLDTDLRVPDLPNAVGRINACLCISNIPDFLQTNDVAKLGVTKAGEQVVREILTSLINNAAPECYHPSNSIQTCANGDPCGFICTNGFDPCPPSKPTDCLCDPPKQICNGICASSCPSSVPYKRDVMSCGYGLTSCGTTGSRSYECVNTKTNLESCGGCSIPFDAYSPRGRDCSSIPGVASVSCVNAACIIQECMPGYTVSYDRSTCYDEDTFAKDAIRKYRIASGFI